MPRLPSLSAIALASLVLSACGTMEPQVPSGLTPSTARNAATSHVAGTCSPLRGPGRYYVFSAAGKRNGNAFKSVRGLLTTWQDVKWSKAAASRQPAVAAATPAPRVIGFLYFGSFTIGDQVNCLTLLTWKDSVSTDAIATGKPLVPSGLTVTVLGQGPVVVKINNLSESGGRGTIVLKKPNGTTLISGTIELNGRIRIATK